MIYRSPSEMSAIERFERTGLTLEHAKNFREQLQRNLNNRQFITDDIDIERYSELVATSLAWWPDDTILSRLPEMPDPVSMQTAITRPSALTERLLAHVDRLTVRLETILGTTTPSGMLSMDNTKKSATQVLRGSLDSAAQAVIQDIQNLQSPKQRSPDIDRRSFEFVQGNEHRQVLIRDYAEAQLAFSVGAHKASALLSGGLIEAMLMDTIQWDEVVNHEEYEEAVKVFPRSRGAINWDKVSMTHLIGAASRLGLLQPTTQRMTEGARDFRDTVHPNAEVRTQSRAECEEAVLLLALVRLLYRDLDRMKSKTQKR